MLLVLGFFSEGYGVCGDWCFGVGWFCGDLVCQYFLGVYYGGGVGGVFFDV